jgi:hypothetical protein
MSTDLRLEQLTHWLEKTAPLPITQIVPIRNDASFRRYFRVFSHTQSFIAMDAPPEQEDCRPFCAIARGLLGCGIHVPEIFLADLHHGFLLLTDFGDQTLFSLLSENKVDQLYQIASATLVKLQQCSHISDFTLPLFDAEYLTYELNLFLEWYLNRHLQLSLSTIQRQILQETFTLLINNAQQQPQVIIHRDYHSRNLMLLPEEQIGVLDFQDAMLGPITYDLVSLLKDCYIAWPPERVQAWALNYYRLLSPQQLKNSSDRQFLRWFDLMGLQRHLKVLGIFARLRYRDNKVEHIKNTPRIVNYINEVLENYPELLPFRELMATVIIPQQEKILA